VSLHGLERLERTRQLGLMVNPLLMDVMALRSLRIVDDTMALTALESLQSLHGLEKLELVGGTLWLTELPRVESLEGLEGLRRVGRLVIENNNSLRSLDGVSALERVTEGVSIRRNPVLPQSEIDALLSRVNVSGAVFVENNGE
jgi:hypothetical protein